MSASASINVEEGIRETNRLTVSVIIPTKNRANDLVNTIESLAGQTVIPSELIIIDQSGSNEGKDRVFELLERRRESVAGMNVIYCHDTAIRSGAEARNRAMDLAKSQILLFLDDDVELESRFIEELVNAYHERPDAAGVSGIVTNYKPPRRLMRVWITLFERGVFRDDRRNIYWNAAQLRESAPIRVSRFTGALMSFRAGAVRSHRFDANLIGVSDGEDVDFCVRLGRDAVLLIAPKVRLEHHHSRSERLQDHWVRRRARATTFLYHKNWKNDGRSRLYYWWLSFGYALVASAASCLRCSLSPWQALLLGFREGKRPLNEELGPGISGQRRRGNFRGGRR